MILVFGGTTEGKQAIEVLNTLQKPFVYTTKTKIEVSLGSFGVYRYGALTAEQLALLVKDHHIDMIVHASHPFAEVLHQTIAQVSEKYKIPVYRLDRVYPKRLTHPLVTYVPNYQRLVSCLKGLKNSNALVDENKDKATLFLTGVQTIEKLKEYWKVHHSYFRILNRESSVEIALEQNYPKEKLILGMPNKNVSQEIELYKQLNANTIVTKESGNSGQLNTKIQAAIQCNIPIVIIEKPELPESFISVSTLLDVKF